MSKLIQPQVGTTCPALSEENYETHLSGDCAKYLICSVTGKACLGRVIEDKDDESSRFYSRAKCYIDTDKIKKCPMYGCSVSTFETILKERAQKELEDKLKNLNK